MPSGLAQPDPPALRRAGQLSGTRRRPWKFQGVVGNWGIAIVLLTIVVKLLTLYWTTQSMRSMKETAALAPQLKALQAKYADDKQRQQAEQMALYKEHGGNPG